MVSIVACCHCANLCALAARAFLITTVPNMAMSLLILFCHQLDDNCKLVKANLAKEKQKAIANNALELSNHTVLVEQNSIFPLFDISYNNEKCNLFL